MPLDDIIIIGLILGAIFLIIISVLLLWRKVPQDKALIVTGLRKRIISGGGGVVIPMLERTDLISLENMKIYVGTQGALTEQGVGIVVNGVAIIKVKSDKESILYAVEQFNTGSYNKTIKVIEDTSKSVLDGKLREIISKLTVEEIYKDREKFSSQVQEVAALDLADMGLEVKALTIIDISDTNGYLDALGKKRISEVLRDAQIAEANASMETKIKTSEANRLGQEAFLASETKIAEASKEKELRIQSYRKEQESAKAIADLAYEIEKNKVNKEVTETQMQVELIRKQRETELAQQEAIRMEKELDATIIKQAEADKYKEIQGAQARAEALKLDGQARAEARKMESSAEAHGIREKGSAEAHQIRERGTAEADIMRELGLAEAEAMHKKAQAFKQYGDAAITQLIVERLPEIASAISEPLSKTEKIVIVDNGSNGQGGGASKISSYVTDIMATLPQTVEALTGINVLDVLKNVETGQPLNKEQE
ncbi:MAG: SPFH domain-containing protein [Defluviitaleaceae bacterium]|nr:SPFH domain-containing protein [Defluviitaleaceae bacterium]